MAVGDHVRRTGEIPDRVPFAASPTEGWHDVPVLAQLVASVADDVGGAAGTVALHLSPSRPLLVLAASARHLGASDVRAASLVPVLCLGALPALALVRLQTFSLVMFALLVSLLWHQAADPPDTSGGCPSWWRSGATSTGRCCSACVSPVPTCCWAASVSDSVETVAVGVTTLLALCATPQGWDTLAYYASVLDNEAAARGEGLWARPDVTHPFDVLMLAAAVVLAGVALRRRRAAWEYVACLGLAAATAEAARHGVWLLVVLFMVATVPATRPGRRGALHERWAWRPVALVAVVSSVLARARGRLARRRRRRRRPGGGRRGGDGGRGRGGARARAAGGGAGRPRGHRVGGQPARCLQADAQRAYLDFVAGEPGMRPAVEGSDLVVVVEGSASDQGLASLDEPLERRELPGEYVAYLRP